MNLDIRLPIGLMFGVFGALLAIYGAVSPERSQALGHNMNLVWGLCLVAFAALMLASWKLFPQKPTEHHSDAADRPKPPGH